MREHGVGKTKVWSREDGSRVVTLLPPSSRFVFKSFLPHAHAWGYMPPPLIAAEAIVNLHF
jgi:hypothetical protein